MKLGTLTDNVGVEWPPPSMTRRADGGSTNQFGRELMQPNRTADHWRSSEQTDELPSASCFVLQERLEPLCCQSRSCIPKPKFARSSYDMSLKESIRPPQVIFLIFFYFDLIFNFSETFNSNAASNFSLLLRFVKYLNFLLFAFSNGMNGN